MCETRLVHRLFVQRGGRNRRDLTGEGSVVRLEVLTLDAQGDGLSSADLAAAVEERRAAMNSLARYIAVKEEHAELVKHEVRIIWGDYFKPEHLDAYPDLHTTFWKAAKLCSAVKVEVNEPIEVEQSAGSTDSRETSDDGGLHLPATGRGQQRFGHPDDAGPGGAGQNPGEPYTPEFAGFQGLSRRATFRLYCRIGCRCQQIRLREPDKG